MRGGKCLLFLGSQLSAGRGGSIASLWTLEDDHACSSWCSRSSSPVEGEDRKEHRHHEKVVNGPLVGT